MTYLSNGRISDPFNLYLGDLDVGTIYHSLALINRYTGNTKRPYSVAEHSYHLANYVPPFLRRTALIHDWSEVWFNDVPSPIKAKALDYAEMERNCGRHIFELLGVDFSLDDDLKYYDTAIRTDEMRQLFTKPYIREAPGLNVDLSMGNLMDWKQWEMVCTIYHNSVFNNPENLRAEREWLSKW